MRLIYVSKHATKSCWSICNLIYELHVNKILLHVWIAPLLVYKYGAMRVKNHSLGKVIWFLTLQNNAFLKIHSVLISREVLHTLWKPFGFQLTWILSSSELSWSSVVRRPSVNFHIFIFFSRTNETVSTKLGTMHLKVLFNWKLKIFLSRTIGPFST